MIEFILALIKYSVIFMCKLYIFTKLLRIKLKVLDLLSIPLFIAISTVLYFGTKNIKVLIPIGLLIFGILYLFLRFRKPFYETVTVGTIALGISIVSYIIAILGGYVASIFLHYIVNETLRVISIQISISIFQIAVTMLLFKIKRLKSGIKSDKKDATFEILLYFSVFIIFTLMLVYGKTVSQSLYDTVVLIIALFGLLFIIWWFRHITYTYRDALRKKKVENLENTIETYKLNSAENELQVAVYAKLFHYLNKAVPDCAVLAERAAAQSGCADAHAVKDLLQSVLRAMDIANEKCSLQSIPQTGVSVIDAPIIRLYTAAENKNFRVGAEVSADVQGWFTAGKLNKDDIHIILTYVCDNAIISALGSSGANVRLELDATESGQPLIRVYDSGKQFDENVLAKIGLEPVTSRAGVGGSGIGLFTVFEILSKYGASFTLDEAPQNYGFKKCIQIAFNGLRAIKVRTSRNGVAAACAARNDITVELIDGADTELLQDGTNG